MSNFTLRVYGLLISNDHILIASEIHNGKPMTKFPGGGLEFGEGTIDCLKREFREELDIEIDILRHYYTTDFFVASAFHRDTQVIIIYYLVDTTHPESVPAMQELLHEHGTYTFQWIPLAELDAENLTFPIDRHVAGMLLREFTVR